MTMTVIARNIHNRFPVIEGGCLIGGLAGLFDL
jgi:hypothetical protein